MAKLFVECGTGYQNHLFTEIKFMSDLKDLTYDGKEELALALLLWRDFKASGKMNITTIIKQVLYFADMLGIRENNTIAF